MKNGLFIVILIGVFIFASSSSANIIIDFTDFSIWGGADGMRSFSQDYGEVTVTITSLQGGPLNISSIGIGILDEQISYIYHPDPPDVMKDLLEVVFSDNVTVTSYSCLDLFANEGPNGEAETGRANFGRIGPNTLVYAYGEASDGVGLVSVDGLNVTDFSDIHFTAEFGTYSDYALASIEIVPEPCGLTLVALGGLALRRRRKAL